MKILVIEDEEKIALFLKEVLENEKFEVTLCDSVEKALEQGHEITHDLVILDLMLPGKPGYKIIQELKKRKLNIPILVLSALNQINTKIELLQMGADDYMTKPFDFKELIARINTIYRRYLDATMKDQINYGNFNFYRKQNKVKREEKEIFLTPKEGALLEFLIQNKGKTVRTEDILKKIWDAKLGFHSNIVQATVRRLRKKIDQGFPKQLIHNKHGIGYSISLD